MVLTVVVTRVETNLTLPAHLNDEAGFVGKIDEKVGVMMMKKQKRSWGKVFKNGKPSWSIF